MPTRLNDNQIQEQLQNLSGWQRKGDSIEKNFEFKDFDEALGFVNKVGAEAQSMDHHPDICLHSWNQVRLTASTHSENGITDNDIELAGRVNNLIT